MIEKMKFFPKLKKYNYILVFINIYYTNFLNEIKNFGELYDEKLIYKFKFKPGQNCIISNNGSIATKNEGGNNWNCTIFGDKEIRIK